MQGCAIGVGFCAASHLDLVVSKLEQVMKEEMVRKSKGFFGFSKVCSVLAHLLVLALVPMLEWYTYTLMSFPHVFMYSPYIHT